MAKKSFIIYDDFLDCLEHLDRKLIGDILMALHLYRKDGT